MAGFFVTAPVGIVLAALRVRRRGADVYSIAALGFGLGGYLLALASMC